MNTLYTTTMQFALDAEEMNSIEMRIKVNFIIELTKYDSFTGYRSVSF